MLQVQTLPASLLVVLSAARGCFTGPSYRTFAALLAGLVAQPGRRTVCGMLVGAGLSGVWHHSRAHWFFSRARWCAEEVGLALLTLIVARLLAPDAAVVVAVDDTLFRRSGRKVYAAGWRHDGSLHTPGRDRLMWGTCFVVAAVVVDLPFTPRPVCLPVLARLWRPTGPAKPQLACQLVTRIAAAVPDRTVHVVADGAYASADGPPTRDGLRGRGLPAGVSLTSRLRVNAALNAIATPIPGRAGRRRRIGPRIGTPADLAAVADRTGGWQMVPVRRYGRTDTVALTELTCLWYGAYRGRAVRVVLVRQPASTAACGYDLALITTDLTSPAADLVARYAARWAIEVAFEDAKQITGVGQARNRSPRAVERTVPFGLITQSVVIVWYTLTGHHPDTLAEHRRLAPWYRTKTHPSYLDMIVKLRRTLIAARFHPGSPREPTPQETRAVHLAWAQAAA
jgi:hypothetical protein